MEEMIREIRNDMKKMKQVIIGNGITAGIAEKVRNNEEEIGYIKKEIRKPIIVNNVTENSKKKKLGLREYLLIAIVGLTFLSLIVGVSDTKSLIQLLFKLIGGT